MKSTSILSLATAVALAPAAQAAVLLASTNDAAPAYDAQDDRFSRQRINDASINVGRQGPQGRFHQAMVIPFQLPDFGAVADPFLTATFSVRLSGQVNNPSGSIDLYGLDARATSAVLPTSAGSNPGDFFMGGFDGAPSQDPSPTVTLLQAEFIDDPSATGIHSTDSDGSAALLGYLNDAYDGGNGVGQWVFMRLSIDATPGGVAYYAFNTADNATEENRPVINYTAIPEPSAALLGAFGVLALLRRRRA